MICISIIISKIKSIDEIVRDYGEEKKYKTLSKVLSKYELGRLREEGDKNCMGYLRKLYERIEAIKKLQIRGVFLYLSPKSRLNIHMKRLLIFLK